MAAAAASVGSWIASSSSSSRRSRCYKDFTAQSNLSRGLFNRQQCHLPQLNHTKGKHGILFEAMSKSPKRQTHRFATIDNYSSDVDELISDNPEQEQQYSDSEEFFLASNSPLQFEVTAGKAGFISFYGHRSKRETLQVSPNKNQSNLIWFIGPSVLVASFIFPSLYLRRILSSIFEDSLLTDFLILFFTEALFYCGVAAFLVLVDRTRRPLESVSPPTQLLHRITSVATLVLSLIIPMVTMGLVWPWTGPAASATLAPYLVGIVMQFSFEQYAKYKKSSSWPVIPVVFQVYRLHQLNRAAQLVTALSFTVRGVEATPHNAAINSSLGTLLNVLQFLGVICIWSLASFLMRFFPSVTKQE